MKCLKGFKRDIKGAIGIGTLIVFIALILVASIAAAVIIQTADELQNQAERTGADAAASATGGVAVLNSVGRIRNGVGGEPSRVIDTLFLTVGLNAGSEGVGMAGLLIQYTVDTDFTFNATYVRSTLIDKDGNNAILARGELMNLTISGLVVGPGEEFTIKILPPNRVPGTLESYIADWDLSARFTILI
jgi:flagellin FlaB